MVVAFMSLHECDDKVLAPFEYYRKVKGKNIRGILIDCFQEWLLIPAEMLVIVKVSGTIVIAITTSRTSMNICGRKLLQTNMFINYSIKIERVPLLFSNIEILTRS